MLSLNSWFFLKSQNPSYPISGFKTVIKSFDGGIRQLAVYRDAAYEGIPVSRYSEAGKDAMADYEKIGAQILKGWKNV
jgi:hypothetical protein